MAQKINIAELKIDNKALIQSLSQTKKAIDELSATQKVLKQAGDTSSATFVDNEAKLKALKSEYNNQSKALQASQKATTTLNSALEKEITTLDQAKQNNSELRQIRNQLNSETTEGAKAIELLNSKIDENTTFIESNVDAYENQKMQVGDYKNQIIEASQAINPLNGGIAGFTQRSKEAGGVGNLLKTSLGGATQGFIGLTKASLGFIATPIGALLGVLVGAFLLVRNAMNRSEESTNKIKKAFSAFQGITNTLLKILEPLGEFLIDGLAKGFELAEKAIYKGIDAIASGLELLGFDEQAKSLRGFNSEIQQGAKDAKTLAEAEAQLTKAQRESQKIQLEYQRDAEKLRQIRDNENLSIQERIKANEDLGAVLKQQLADELKIAQQALLVANLRIKSEGETKDALDQQAEALTTIADIQERITGQESEQLTNRVALQKEAKEKAKEYRDKQREIADEAIKKQEEELALFIAQQGIKARTLEENLKLEKEISDRRIEILDAELANKNISQEKYDTELLNIKNDLLRRNAEIAVQNAQNELDIYLQNNQSKRDSDLYFSEESLKIEQDRLNAIAEKRREFFQLQLEEGVINQTQYNDAINAINEENRIANEELATERKEAEKEKQIEEIELQRELMAENFQFDLEAQLAYLESKKQQELANAESTGVSKALIEQKYSDLETKIKEQTVNNKLDLASGALGNIAKIAGEESAIGKGASIAQATIDTYKSATSAYSAMAGIPVVGPALGAIAAGAAVAAGIANVKKIVSTKATKQFARGGILNGASHAQGGIPTQYGELEGGEAVINKRSTALYAPLLSAINQAGGGVKFANGGILGGNVSTPPTQLMDYDLLATKMAEANQSLPSPIVSVSEISSVANNVSTIESMATF